MKKIVIGASKNRKIGSKLIRWWIGAPYSHVYTRWHLNDQNRDIVYQASHGMVHFRSYDNFRRDNEIVEEYEIDLTCEQFANFSSKCIDLAGEPYSKIQLLQIFLSDISGGKLKFKDQQGYICSELMYTLLKDLGYETNKPPHLINPKDIIEMFRRR